MTSKSTRNAYVKDRLTYTHESTDRATYPKYIQQHKHNVQMHSVTIKKPMNLVVKALYIYIYIYIYRERERERERERSIYMAKLFVCGFDSYSSCSTVAKVMLCT